MIGLEGMASSYARESSGWKFLLRKSSSSLERVTQGGGGVTVPGIFKKSLGQVLRDMDYWIILVVWGQLDQIILKVFSSLNDSMIL